MERGFTLVELMIVVVIICVLAALGTVGFKRYVARARSGEAVAMLAEMSSKEQTYKLEFANYLPLRADNKADLPSPNESADAFYPVSAGSSVLESARTAISVADSSKWPDGWKAVGIRPRDSQLYCTYLTNAGNAGNDTSGLKYGALVVGASAAPWFYSLAACNLDGASGYPDNVSIYTISSVSSSLRIFNEGK